MLSLTYNCGSLHLLTLSNVGKTRKFITLLCQQKYVVAVKSYLAKKSESYRPYNFKFAIRNWNIPYLL